MTGFLSDEDVDNTELGSMIRRLSSSRRQTSVFESPDLMVTTGWFVYDVPLPPRLCSRREECSESESGRGDSGFVVEDAGGI